MAMGFYVDVTSCIGCRTCQVACKDRWDLQEAGPRPRRVESFEAGTYPEVGYYHISMSCNHCENPACVAGCPTGALYKDKEGIVRHDDSRCVVCRNCMTVCPYGAPQYDEVARRIVKCDACAALREAGMNPVCVDACPMRAIEFGDIDDLRAAHGDAVSDLPAIADPAITGPNAVWSPLSAAMREDFEEVVL